MAPAACSPILEPCPWISSGDANNGVVPVVVRVGAEHPGAAVEHPRIVPARRGIIVGAGVVVGRRAATGDVARRAAGAGGHAAAAVGDRRTRAGADRAAHQSAGGMAAAAADGRSENGADDGAAHGAASGVAVRLDAILRRPLLGRLSIALVSRGLFRRDLLRLIAGRRGRRLRAVIAGRRRGRTIVLRRGHAGGDGGNGHRCRGREQDGAREKFVGHLP